MARGEKMLSGENMLPRAFDVNHVLAQRVIYEMRERRRSETASRKTEGGPEQSQQTQPELSRQIGSIVLEQGQEFDGPPDGAK